MEYSWRLSKCPKCEAIYNWQIVKFIYFIQASNILGPKELHCEHCGNIFPSGLNEWSDLKFIQKLHYLLISTFYSAILGFMMALTTTSIIERVVKITNPNYLSSITLLTWTFVFSIPIFIFHLFRVYLSVVRSESDIQEPMEASFWNWQINPFFYGFLLEGFCLGLFFMFTFIH